MPRRTPALAALAALTLLVAGCGDDYSRDDAIAELTDAGFDEDTANCIVDTVEEQGLSAEDVAKADEGDAEVQAAATEAATTCLTGADADAVLDLADMSEEEIREQMLQSLATQGIAAEDAECIYDEFLAAGGSARDLLSAGLEGATELPADLQAVFQEAATACGLG